MAKRTQLTWIVLLLITVIVGLISMSFMNYAVVLILMLSAVKFLGVAFEFMEIRTAHSFWKIAVVTFLMIFIGITLIVFESL